MSVVVRVLQANHGDCILVTHEGPSSVFNVLIDGGPSQTFRHGPRGRYPGALCVVLDELKSKGQQIDLLILSHIDEDHIKGLIKAFERPDYLRIMVKNIWFNSSRLITRYFDSPEIPGNNITLSSESPETSVRQGMELEALLDEIGCHRTPLIMAGQSHELGPFKFKILSPGVEQLKRLLHKWPAEESSGDTSSYKKDYHLSLADIWAEDQFESDRSDYNGSSIAFVLECDGKSMLFLGDAHDDVVTNSLRLCGHTETNKLKLELVKVSHHASQYNTSDEFISLLDSPRYVVSTNGVKHGLPNKRAIARLIKSTNGKILFNYPGVITPLLLPHEVEEYSSRLEVLGRELRF
ncbi:ComEC/Rec2 family competence protein [Pseudomonas donghuensis]|uniref:ComEC/Rec2 family competence protein n=1 Tax=Pseudomonas donghuensis TaxID=1163398 RepID=UPI002E0F8A14|nr:MBL fold metallo-hydrolase [Pseudomonas donghuensis]